MAKSKKRNSESKKSSQVDSQSSTLAHNPFASLASLGGTLPEESAMTEPPVVTTARNPKANPRFPPKAASSNAEFPGKLVVRREVKGRSGKTVTRIAGIAPDKLSDLAKKMKKALGCGAVVEGSDIVLLGSLVDRVAAWLEKAGASQIVKGN